MSLLLQGLFPVEQVGGNPECWVNPALTLPSAQGLVLQVHLSCVRKHYFMTMSPADSRVVYVLDPAVVSRSGSTVNRQVSHD